MATLLKTLQQEFDDNGNPLYGSVVVKNHDTNTLSTLYQDIELTPAPNPFNLPLSGRAEIFVGNGLYDVFLKDDLDGLGTTLQESLGVSGGIGLGLGSETVVNTIAEMKALTPGATDYVIVGGYYTKGDGKAIEKYWYDSTLVFATEPDNGGTIIQPLSAPAMGGWRAITNRQALTPYNFGAKGDGTTDDTTAFQKMLNASSNVYLPEGRFRVTSTLSFTDTDFAPAGDPTRRFGTTIRGAGTTKSYIYAKEITGPLFNHPGVTFPSGLEHEATYLSDFTVTGANDGNFGTIADCSTTFTGIIGNSQVGEMTAGIVAERVRQVGSANVGAKAWDLSQMFDVKLKSCKTEGFYYGFAYYGATVSETSTNIQISDCYSRVCKQIYEFQNILDVTFSNQCIFESCDVIGVSYWSNIKFYDCYTENIGTGTAQGITQKSMGISALNISPYNRATDTAFHDVGGTLTFIGGEFTQISAGLTGFFQGVGTSTKFSNGGKVTFINCRSHMSDRVIFNEDGRNGYIYDVQDQMDSNPLIPASNYSGIILTATGYEVTNYQLIKNLTEARKLSFGHGKFVSKASLPKPSQGQAFTASSSSGLLLTVVKPIAHLQKVRFLSTGTLPTGLSLATDYWVAYVSATTYKIGTTLNNASTGVYVAYTDAGTGTHVISEQYDADRLSEVYEVKNGRLSFGYTPGSTYTTTPMVDWDKNEPYKSGDEVILNSGIALGDESKLVVTGRYDTVTNSTMSAGGFTVPIADTSTLKIGNEVVIKLSGVGNVTTTATRDAQRTDLVIASTTGVSVGDKVTMSLTGTGASGVPLGIAVSYEARVQVVHNATTLILNTPFPIAIPSGTTANIVEGYLYTSVASIPSSTSFLVANPVPTGRSVANGASVYSWRWMKSGFGDIVSQVIEYLTSPKFTGGINLGSTDSPIFLENGNADDVNLPAMKIKERRYLTFLNNNGDPAKGSPIGVNPNGELTIGNAGGSKIRVTAEGLVFGGSTDDAMLVCGAGAPGTGQTFTASSSSGLLLTYATDIPNYHRVRFTTTTTLPTGLSLATDYWVIKVSATTCRVATSLANAIAGTAIAYTDAGTGTHTVQLAHKKGSIYSRLDGSATNNRMYVNTDGAFAWTNVTTAT